MKANVKGIIVEGTAEEIKKLLSIRGKYAKRKKRKYTKRK